MSRRAGAGLLAASVVALVGAVGLGVGTGWFAREYRAFTALHVNQTAAVRFVDAGGFRYDLWRVAVREFRSHPFGGVGAGNYDTDYYRLRKNPEYVVQPHSIELQMAAELGVVGLLAFLLFCGAIFHAGFARRGTLAAGDPLIRIAALGVFTAWLVDTSVDWLYDIPGLAAAAIVAAALLVAPPETSPPSGDADRRRGRGRGRAGQAALVAGFAAIALLAASVGRQYAATRYMVAGQHQIASAPRQAIDKLREAARLDPYSVSTLYLLSAAYARLDDYQHARDALLLASAREPHNYVPPALLGDLATRRGDRAAALASYQRTLALNPRDPDLQRAVAEAGR
jgi:O-antigen ligase